MKKQGLAFRGCIYNQNKKTKRTGAKDMMDMDKYIKKAQILIEALPYIQGLSGKTIVIKYGGSAMLDDSLKSSVMEDITLLKFIGTNPIIVHGADRRSIKR